jgi:hypothetical protein
MRICQIPHPVSTLFVRARTILILIAVTRLRVADTSRVDRIDTEPIAG